MGNYNWQNGYNSFSYPEDREKLKHFIAENMNKDVCVEISGIRFFLKPDRDIEGFIWYTDPYGIDGGVFYLDEQGGASSHILFRRIWEVSAFGSK